MKTKRSTILGALVTATACILLTGCGSGSPQSQAQPKTLPTTQMPTAIVVPIIPTLILPTTPNYSKCADLYVPGQVINDAQAITGCLDPDGTAILGGWQRCDDGRHLISMDASSGAPAGWGFGADVYHATSDLNTDPAYKAAYDVCNGITPEPSTS